MLSRIGATHGTRRGLPDDRDRSKSRYIEAAVNGILIVGLYMPNGNPCPGPKFDYKLAWLERLIDHAGMLLASGAPSCSWATSTRCRRARFLHAERWLDDALFAPEVRAAFSRQLEQGWTDALRPPELRA
jgi:exodeoxyribonuclease-3